MTVMGVSLSAGTSAEVVVADGFGAVFGVASAVAWAAFCAVLLADTEAAGPVADRRASPAPGRRVGGEALAPVAARVGLGTALPAVAFVAVPAACVAPVAASDAFVLLVVTAVILAL
ncbi:hypothetical protein [Catenulispora sp. EB89]|uniref:hypothetical protein n=1 Tax=Catenulispora sp. EB89 TaxID=3156257 RepID=UPI003512D70F